MKLWEKVKNFIIAHKNRRNFSEHKKNMVSEGLQLRATLEKINEIELKNLADGSSANKVTLLNEGEFHKPLEDTNSDVKMAFQFTKLYEAEVETGNLRKKIQDNELVIIENSVRSEIPDTELRDIAKKIVEINNLKQPLTSMPKHNEEVDFKKFKDDYQYYLVKGSEYEQIRAIQSIKRAVRNKDSNHEEWLDILSYIYRFSNKKIQKYILDTLGSFSLNSEEKNRISELNPPEKTVEDIKKSDYILDKPRIVGSRTVKEKVKEPIQSVANTEEKNPYFNGAKYITLDDGTNREGKIRAYQNPLSLQANLPNKVNQLKLSEKEYIKEECLKRNITSIYHFTNERNLEKILRYGILSTDELRKKNIDFESNDNVRRDGMKNSTCWSISFPNNKYFYRVRERHPEMKWCVIEADASLLFDLECYYFETNAASNAVRAHSTNKRKGYTSFMEMFVRRSPEDSRLPPKYPTDVQAEVLITKNIEPNRIKAIHTQDVKVFDYYQKLYPHLVKYTPALFGMR